MNISSIKNNWLLYSNYLNTSNINNSQSTLNTLDLQDILSNTDGDTLELSGDSQNVASKYMLYGPPPPQGPNGSGPAPSPEIKDFLDKVTSGTVTEDDLTKMQSILQKAQQQDSSNTNNTAANDRKIDPIRSFLDKVTSGTVTDEDLTEMQSVLQQMQQQFSVNNANDLDSNNTDSDPIKVFLDKVASGTVTNEDLTEMKNTLLQMQEQHSNIGAYKHHHASSESDSTNPTGTSLDATSINSTEYALKSFLDKVADGTTTESDLKDMQIILQQMQQQYFNGFANTSNSINSDIGRFMAQIAYYK